MARVTTTSITYGILAIGGWRIIQIGFELIIRNGPKTEIGISTIIGMIAAGGNNMTRDGHNSIITIGTSI